MMMETYLDVVRGMGEVDKVLNNCERIGQQLSSVMRIWQSGAASTDPNVGMNTASDVGLNIVAISDEVYEQRVVPSQNPEVQAAFQGYLRKKPEGVPDSVTLKDYQMLGVNWLNLLWNRRTSCILADEMGKPWRRVSRLLAYLFSLLSPGLGKTIQVIALLAHIKATDQPGPHLVVVPSSTLENWIREFSVFAPGLKVETYYGSQSERADIRHELRQMTDLDVVVTTYNIATSSPEDQKFLKKKMDFKVTVFDEGHQLKNSESKKYKDLMQIKAQWRLLLTGTPLQNNLQELVVSTLCTTSLRPALVLTAFRHAVLAVLHSARSVPRCQRLAARHFQGSARSICQLTVSRASLSRQKDDDAVRSPSQEGSGPQGSAIQARADRVV